MSSHYARGPDSKALYKGGQALKLEVGRLTGLESGSLEWGWLVEAAAAPDDKVGFSSLCQII